MTVLVIKKKAVSYDWTNKYTNLLDFKENFNEFMIYTGELGYERPLYDRLLSMKNNMLGPSPMHIKYVSYVYDRFRI